MIEVGDSVPLSFTVTDGGVPVDATVTLTVDRPDGTPVSPTVTRTELGRYAALLVATQAGRHVVRWAATGAATAALVDVVNVARATAPVAIISLAEAKEHLNMVGSAEDDELRGFIGAASRVVERHTRRVVAVRTIVEDVTLTRSGLVVLQAAPIVSVTSVTSLDGATAYSASVADGANGIVSVSGGSGRVRVTVVAGQPQVPEDTIMATRIICAHLWSTQRVQTLGASPGFGGPDMGGVPTGRGYLVPNQAAQLLGGRAPNSP